VLPQGVRTREDDLPLHLFIQSPNAEKLRERCPHTAAAP
jgi:hypothetical protein